MNAWLFYLSSNDYYLYMLLGAYKNLLDTKTKYPVYCAITDGVTDETATLLDKIGIKTIKLSKKSIGIKLSDIEWYKKAIDKLQILELDDKFDKAVYLDTDLWIRQNIDELFDMPHMTAVINQAPIEIRDYKLGGSVFCSGLFVWDYKNNKGLGRKLLSALKNLPKNIDWHDQAILNYWYQDWKDNYKHLDYRYGLMNCNNPKNFNGVKIIHMTRRDRNNWPFYRTTYVKEDFYMFVEWVESIAEAVSFFNKEYNLNIPSIQTQNLSYLEWPHF